MTRMFINYRRSDSAPYAGRLRDHLVQRFGDDAVFMDVDDIAPGTDFPNLIGQTLLAADAILVVIGPGWLDLRGGDGRRRLDDERDYVRLEIAKGIEQRKRVIPLLVGGARMPRQEELPPPLAELARLNALEISDQRFDDDMRRLMAVLAPGAASQGDAATHRAPALVTPQRVTLALAAAVAIAGWAWWGLGPRHDAPGAASVPSSTPATLIDGTWNAAVTYVWGATHQEVFRFKTQGGAVSGSAGFLGVPRTLIDGRIAGDQLVFSTQTEELLGSAVTRALTHRYHGTVNGDAIDFVLATEGSGAPGGATEFTAHRAPP